MSAAAARSASPRVRRLLGLAVVLLVAYGVASWFASERLLAPRRRVPGEAAGAPFAALTLSTDDGLSLAGWLAEPDGPARATVLVFHGLHGHRSRERLELLADHGFRALAVDHRAHGASDGVHTGYGWPERLDVKAALDLARTRWPDDPLLAWATSLGGAALVYALTHEADDAALSGAVLESVYTDIDTAFANRLRLHFGPWIRPFAEGPRQLVLWRTGLDAERLRPLDLIDDLGALPLLLTVGAEDRRATPAEQDLLAAAAVDAEVLVVPELGHTDLLRRGPPDYGPTVIAFLQGCLVRDG